MLKQIFSKNWPPRYRYLLYVVIDVAILLVALGWFYILPRWIDYTRLREEVRRLKKDAAEQSWSSNPVVLRQLLQRNREWIQGAVPRKNGSRGIKGEERRILARASNYLRQKIVENYPAIINENEWMVIDNFVRTSSRIDFKYLANQLEAEFAEKKLCLPDPVVQITETRKEPVYQRILQLWVIDYLFQKLEANHLRIDFEKNSGMARIELLPPQGFILEKTDKEPFLWEFPVKITVRGTLQNFFRLQESLTSRKYFFPVRNLSVYTFPPDELPRKEDVVEISEQTITFTVSSFFLPGIPPVQEDKH